MTTFNIGVIPGDGIGKEVIPEGEYPSMFEPVHGSAPDIAGKGIANPIAAIWSAAMMLDNLEESGASAAIMKAIETVLKEGIARTPDMGGNATTEECGNAIAAVVKNLAG